ncbi:MAG: iron complex outermembrane receptor protein [Planctomycetota bacterium]|jgi:iron complex outermembrane receptor protein
MLHESRKRGYRHIRPLRLPPTWGILIVWAAIFSVAVGQQDETMKDPDLVENGTQEDMDELSELDLADLLDMEVTSVSKSAQPLSHSPAAIFVVTQDDIQRAGARSIPEALRLVPGIEVAQVTRHRWAVTARGFNGIFASKMLVLMDGRTLYTPLFSGTFWNQQSTPVENIDRIEVIRGPGATLWGANAVNGIINIITKSAKETLGGRVKTVVGTNNIENVINYGMKVGEDAHLRVYGQYFDRDDFGSASSSDTHGDWAMKQIGFRLDMLLSGRDELTVQGDAYDGTAEQTIDISDPTSSNLANILEDTIDIAGANLITRWKHRISDEQDFTLQLYVDRTERTDGLFKDTRNTYDLDFQHRFAIGDSNRVIWGVGYRYVSDDFEGSFQIFADPDARRYQIFSAFVQDELTLVENELKLTFGSKFSHNDFSGFEIQPSVRLIWTPAPEHTLWTAVSRAVETPSRGTQDLTIRQNPINLGGSPVIPVLHANEHANSIDLIAFEVGYRVRPASNLSFDLAMFYNDYEHVATNDILGVSIQGGLPLLQAINQNRAKAESYGFEVSSEWRPYEALRVSASYSFIRVQVHGVGTTDPEVNNAEGNSPNHRVVLRAHWNITDDLEFNTSLFWTDNLRTQNIPSYVRLDLQVRWRPLENLELAIGVRNLLDRRHPEYGGTFGRQASEVDRTAYFWMDFTF